MEAATQHTVEVLNTLLKNNNDRQLGYDKAAADVNELDLKTVFKSMGDESRKNSSELAREIRKLGGDPAAAETTRGGKMLRMWMGVKALLIGKDRNFIMRSCQFGEDAIQNAYRDAISSTEISTEVRQLIRNQQAGLRASVDLITNYRERSHYGFAHTG